MMEQKIPTMLWKSHLLDLVSEAPKAHCVECKSKYNRFFTCPSTTSGDDLDIGSESSDFSNHSLGLSSELDPDLLNGNAVKNSESNIEKLTELIQINLKIAEAVDGKDNGEIDGRRRSCKTAAAPWHRPSIQPFFNPFGSAFHGHLSRSMVKRLLADDGDYLVRKREEDADDEFLLSVRFNGHLKNFMITFDDNSGTIYLANREKRFEDLEELVQDGLVTMSLEIKAGPYIDLLFDLTQQTEYRIGGYPKYLASLTTSTKSPKDPFTPDNCIYEIYEKPGESGKNKNGNSYKQNSPSPVSSLSGSSLERVRQPDLKSHSFKTHTFQQLSKCHFCRNFLWGLSSQGLLCQHCGLTIHENCFSKVSQECQPDISLLPSVFGVSLTILVKATSGTKPPFVLQNCISEIDKRGLQTEGIYRISGTREATERLKSLLETDRENSDLSGHSDIHSICGIVKQFLRRLPEPLISEEVFQTFLTRNNKITPSVSSSTPTSAGLPTINVDTVRSELKKLPPAHYICLKYLLQHLHRVAEHSEKNKMNPFNLSSVFAPSLFCPLQISIETLQTSTILLELMIAQVKNLFPK